MLSKEWYINFYGEDRGKLLYKLEKLNSKNKNYSYHQYYRHNKTNEIMISYSINHYYTWHSLKKIKKYYPNKIIKFIDDEVVAVSCFDVGEQLALF